MLYVDGWLSEVIGLLRSPSVLIRLETQNQTIKENSCKYHLDELDRPPRPTPPQLSEQSPQNLKENI